MLCMSTFLLTWNSEKWVWDDESRADEIEVTASGASVSGQWATGNRTKEVNRGDRAFLIQQGPVRGLVASGRFTSEVFQSAHWDQTPGKLANYALVAWDRILSDEDMIPVDLVQEAVSTINFDNLQSSGVRVPPPGDHELESLWAEWAGTYVSPNEEGSDPLPEGARTRVTVNRYERNRQARERCIAHYGLDCQVCNLDFSRRYGLIGQGFIHVHHLVEISTIGGEYVVDPIADLRPVCPNCHAMLHTRVPAYSVDELRDLLDGH